jgi:hypothetical protein
MERKDSVFDSVWAETVVSTYIANINKATIGCGSAFKLYNLALDAYIKAIELRRSWYYTSSDDLARIEFINKTESEILARLNLLLREEDNISKAHSNVRDCISKVRLLDYNLVTEDDINKIHVLSNNNKKTFERAQQKYNVINVIRSASKTVGVASIDIKMEKEYQLWCSLSKYMRDICDDSVQAVHWIEEAFARKNKEYLIAKSEQQPSTTKIALDLDIITDNVISEIVDELAGGSLLPGGRSIGAAKNIAIGAGKGLYYGYQSAKQQQQIQIDMNNSDPLIRKQALRLNAELEQNKIAKTNLIETYCAEEMGKDRILQYTSDGFKEGAMIGGIEGAVATVSTGNPIVIAGGAAVGALIGGFVGGTTSLAVGGVREAIVQTKCSNKDLNFK